MDLVGAQVDYEGHQTDRVTCVSTSLWYHMPDIISGTELWNLMNETASQVLYVALDPKGDPNRIQNFAEYFTLTGLGGGRDHIALSTKPRSIWVKGAAANQVAALLQIAKDRAVFKPTGREGKRKW